MQGGVNVGEENYFRNQTWNDADFHGGRAGYSCDCR